MSESVYRRLQQHLDSLATGFPRTESGIEMELLKRLFDPEEAEVASRLQAIPETVEEFSNRTGIDSKVAERLLERMAGKGQIFRMRRDGRNLYCAACFLPGIWEYQLNSLDPQLARMFERFYEEGMGRSVYQGSIPIFRVLPIDERLTMGMEVTPYDKAKEIIRSQKHIALARCICRKEKALAGKRCDHMDDVCLLFSHMARYYVDNGLARFISVEEALDVLEEAERDGLVHSPQNAKRPMGFCNCCGCCCGILRGITQLNLPASKVVRSDYYCVCDQDSCAGCGECTNRCHVGAIGLDEEMAKVERSRCIGCGLCISTCPTGSLSLARKRADEIAELPGSVSELMGRLAAERSRRSKSF